MKKLAFLIMFIPCALYANTYSDIADELMGKIPEKSKKSAVAVVPFNGEVPADNSIATEETSKALVNAGAHVVEREHIDKILNEQALSQAGVISELEAANVGKASGAKYIVIGSTTRFSKYDNQDNLGIKISVKLVEISTYKTIAIATGEVSADDGISSYQRKEPKKAAGYPSFLEFYGGLSKFEYKGNFSTDDYIGKSKNYDSDTTMDRGFLLGLRLTTSKNGFFASSWDFGYRQQEKKDWGFKSQIYDLSWNPAIRIPLWTYIPALPIYTNVYAGLAFGAAFEKVKYKNLGKSESNSGLGISSSARGGFKLGLGESVALFTEYRYYFKKLNKIWRHHKVGSDDATGTDSFTGHSVIIGFSLAP
ncbi:MAG TPA: CsgG/HfaB family protein [Spirochaetota bacterium]|nr:CsgG/HfaB family protein [Spirochaetota bacterium]